jgi:fatty-acid peroxygenase
VVLDLYGTNHDPARWDDPDRFDPDRFLSPPGPFDLVPQGGGDHLTGHRCAGEWVTVALMATATRMLTQRMDYDVPLQDLRLSWRKVPALPDSGFVIADVRRR